jgi:recombinational DNA repair protein RecR
MRLCNMVKKNSSEILVNLGIKQALIDKLEPNSREMLAAYAMDNTASPTLLQSLIQLASMELQGKRGAIMLAYNGLANCTQIKNINSAQISELCADYDFHQDKAVIIKSIKKMLVISQQEKMFHKTMGVKGEFFVDPSDSEDLEDIEERDQAL